MSNFKIQRTKAIFILTDIKNEYRKLYYENLPNELVMKWLITAGKIIYTSMSNIKVSIASSLIEIQ